MARLIDAFSYLSIHVWQRCRAAFADETRLCLHRMDRDEKELDDAREQP
jgi:hypothetical protein